MNESAKNESNGNRRYTDTDKTRTYPEKSSD